MIKAYLQYWLMKVKQFPKYLRRLIWDRTIKLSWYRLWVRSDEFHPSLDCDLNALLVMNKKQQEKYWEDLGRRREIAHKREFKDWSTFDNDNTTK